MKNVVLTILVVIIPLLSYTQVACGEFTEEDFRIENLDCEGDEVSFSTRILLGQNSIFELSNNGVPINDAVVSGNDTSFVYAANDINNFPPFELVSWEVNGMTLSGDFNNLDELVDLLNELDPTGNWQESFPGFLTSGASSNTYGLMTIRTGNNQINEISADVLLRARFGFDLPIAQNYNFEVLNTNENCVDNIDIELDCEFTSTADQFDESNFLTLDIYPNPVGDEQVQINYELAEASNVQLELYNAYGQLVEVITNNIASKEMDNSITYSTNDLQSGVYFLKFTINDKIVTRKLVKN